MVFIWFSHDLFWGGPRTLKAVLIPGSELPFPALAGFFDTYDLVGLGLLAGSGRLWPALAGPGRPPNPMFDPHTPFLTSLRLLAQGKNLPFPYFVPV